jgi:hypothetical protein
MGRAEMTPAALHTDINARAEIRGNSAASGALETVVQMVSDLSGRGSMTGALTKPPAELSSLINSLAAACRGDLSTAILMGSTALGRTLATASLTTGSIILLLGPGFVLPEEIRGFKLTEEIRGFKLTEEVRGFKLVRESRQSGG